MSSKASDHEDEDEDGFIAVCTILAGPNGSGKSSIHELLDPVGEFVNADVIARAYGLGEGPAGRRAISRLEDLQRERKDFVFETTLSSHHSINVMRKARHSGYEVGLVFVALADVELNVRRVAERVARGGHNIPEDVIRRRYPKSIRNLARAVPLAHASVVYDNTGHEPEMLVLIRGDVIERNNLDEARQHHVLIAEALAEALSLGTDEVFRSAKND